MIETVSGCSRATSPTSVMPSESSSRRSVSISSHDAVRDPQAQAGALLVFGREERLEDARLKLLRDALARVAEHDVHRVTQQELMVGPVRDAGAHVDVATLRHRLLRVEQDVQQHLLDLIG